MSNKNTQFTNEGLVHMWLEHYANRCPIGKLRKRPLCIAFARGYVEAIKDVAYKYAKGDIDAILNVLDDLMEQCKNDSSKKGK